MKVLKSGGSYYGEFITSRADTGAATDADSTPTATATKNGTDDGTFSLTVTKIDTGRYKITGTVPAYTAGDIVQISAAATVNSVAGKGIVDEFVVVSARPGIDAISADLIDDTITASKFDESTAFPVKSADTGSTAIARTGADSDTLETISDQLDTVAGYVDSIPADILDHEITDHLTAGTIGCLIASLGGKMTVTGNQLIVYAYDNTTELFRFNLTDSAGDPTMTNVYTRTFTAAP